MPYAINMTEQELIKDCLNNNRLAQKMLYEKYCKAMYTVAYRITSDFETANDVLQESFVKIFQNLSGFRQESSLGAWIKTIVVRTALSKLRKKNIMEPIESANLNDWVDWGDYLEVEYLEKAIQSLPEGYRTVFVLIEVEGFTHKEVAELLGITTGTSKSQLYYAKKNLRKIISELLNFGVE